MYLHKLFGIIFCFILCMFGSTSFVLAKSHSGKITMTVDLSSHSAEDAAELWIPYPVSDKDQNITDVAVSGNFTDSAVYTDSTYSTPMLYARWKKGAASRKLTFSFQAKRNEVVRRDFPAKEADLGSGRLCPLSAGFETGSG